MSASNFASERSSMSDHDVGDIGQYTDTEKPELQRLASVLSTTISRMERTEENNIESKLFERWAKDSRLDPKDPAFDFSRWAKTLLETLESHGLMQESERFGKR